MDPTPGDSLSVAIDKLIAVKAEHRKILQSVSDDAGMTPATRRTLVEHLLQEEDELVRRIAALAGRGGLARADASGDAGRLTVGSLRVAHDPPWASDQEETR